MATATQHASSPAVPIKQAGATPGGKGTPHVGDRRRRDGRVRLWKRRACVCVCVWRDEGASERGRPNRPRAPAS
jgi:hypothetical protein